MESKEEPSEQQTEQERDRLRRSSSSSSRRPRRQRDPLDLDHLVLQMQELSSSGATHRHVILKEAEESLRYDYESTQLSLILDQLDPSKHCLGYLYIIDACISAPVSEEQATTLVPYIDRFISFCAPEQIRLDTEKFISVCKRFKELVFIHGTATRVHVDLFLAAVRKLQNSSEHLTTLHPPLLHLCLLANCSKTGLSILEEHISEVDYLDDLFQYCYYGGLICIGQQHFREALELLHNVVTAPMSTLNSIAVEAYKKYILVSLIHHGQFSTSLPEYASSAAWRNLKSFCQPYIELANSYSTGEIAELKVNIQTNEKNFITDENHGLVEQVLSSMYKQKIQRLAQTDPSLSLEDIANEVQLNNLEAVEMHVLRMIQDGEIFATINREDGMVRFVEGPEQYKTCEMIERIGSSIQRIMSLSRKLTTMEEQISCDPQYLAQFNKDRITELPELVLSRILSMLTMRDVVKIGIQSRRWASIRLLRIDVDFDVPNMFHSINDMPELSYFPFVFGNNKKRGKPPFDNEVLNIFARIRHELVRRVDQFLLSFRGEKIRLLRVCFFFDHRSTSSLNNWIHRAISLEVEEMNILLSNKPYFSATVPEDKRYCFPHKLFSGHSTLKQLHLELAVLKAPSEFSGFNRLETLYLVDVIVGEEFLGCLSLKCLVLKVLKFEVCGFSSALKIDSQSLRHLGIINCHGMLKVEIYAKNLRAFEYCGFHEVVFDIYSVYFPHLENMYLYFRDGIPDRLSLYASMPKLQTLIMHMAMSSNIISRVKSIDSLGSITQLELSIIGLSVEDDLLWISTILDASPLLEKLSVSVMCPLLKYAAEQREMRESLAFSHNRLKEVTLGGCVGNLYEVEFAICMLKNVDTVERVVLTPSHRLYKGGGQWVEVDAEPSWFLVGRERVRELLEHEVPTEKIVLL